MTTYTEDELPGVITTWKKESEDWRMPFEEKNLRLYKLYRLYLDLDETYFWESKVFIPEAFTVVWTAIPKMIKALLDQEPYIKLRPLRRDVIEGAKIGEGLLTEQLKQINETGLYMFLIKTLQDMLIYGNSFMDVSWKFEESMKRRRVPVYGIEMVPVEIPGGVIEIPLEVYQGDRTENELEVIYDAPDVVPVDWFDVYPDPLATSLHRGNSRYLITREIASEERIEDLKNIENYKNLTDINFTFDETSISNYDEKKQIDEVINTFGTKGGGQAKTELLRCQWSKFHKGRYEEWWTIIADGKTVIYNDRSPYFHDKRTTLKTDCFPLTNRMYSIGLLEPAEDMLGAINQRFNQMADIVTMALSPMTKVKGSALWNKLQAMFGSTIPTTPGLFLPMETNEDISPVYQVADVRPGQDEIAFMKDMIEESTASPEISKGILPERKETATGLALAQNQAGERFITIMNVFFYTGLRPMTQQMLALNHQFKDIPTEMEIENEQGVKEFREVSMNEIPEDGMAFEPNMAFIDPLVNKEARAAMLAETALQIAQTPGARRVNWDNLTKNIFKLRAGGIESDDLLLTDDEMAQQDEQEAQRLLQLAAGQPPQA